MEKKIKARDLKVGMYVILPTSWFRHPFLKNKFNITSEDEIRTIIKWGLKEVLIDPTLEEKIPDKKVAPEKTSKAASPSASKTGDTGAPVTVIIADKNAPTEGYKDIILPHTWEAEKLMLPELREAIHDKNLPPQKKAEAVYKSSLTIMSAVLETPTAESIQEVKAGISEIVDLIISDDETSKYLLSITSHDFYTYTHSVRVGVFSVMLAKSLYKNSSAHDMHELGAGFFLHDIGKTRINPDIINKPGKLDEEEWKEMKTHPFLGYKILSDTDQLTKESRIIVLQHHEWNNGKGYPNGLKGNEIHEYARICSIADVYDAITSERPYKKKKETFEALSIMKEEMNDHFGEVLFEKFVLLFL
ncbi:MAG: HD-GYP domain-containing protein [Deltaproteobacteria bacterium]|nr:HD-GYP domain-containing protein [Deltaproteobacteria bacterium]